MMRIITSNDTMRAYSARLRAQNTPPSHKPKSHGLAICANCAKTIPGCDILCAACYLESDVKPHWISEEERRKKWKYYGVKYKP
jgi:hypothetical protein